ncbi:Constitutive coactivator of peroxisome proliferator-activated receptor gamma [Hondaea fermentalgiana]|uniref:Constitutive coactivator of peroxisome proliferator-activated receptor gamma n=1 Tax=Hondaea fermentalgiana TaxID=2315210 RepID=A0A2R5GP39_9STRA|nr:Constitutive coactivator of peroxisome proliferator-activated receptor gamma [Hondaea fermentalgiana]|eukprot:GBG32646.1 Constitutive coactivator of peroxisome proliferator-activated receptor gamma [Hondaea fermentalgiana]
MGVRGLARLARTRCTPTRVELGPANKLLIDGPALTYHLFQETRIPWHAGGDLASFARAVRGFASDLCSCGVRLEIFFDLAEAVDDAKIQCTLQRRAGDVRAVKKVVKALANAECPPGFVLPLLAFDVVRTVFKDLGVPVTEASASVPFGCEADPYIARAAGLDPSAIVLTNDSDLLCFAQVSAVAFLDYLEVVDDSLTVVRTFRPQQVAAALGIAEKDLPSLACLVGNDHGDPMEIALWHDKLKLNRSALNSQQVILAAAAALRKQGTALATKLGSSWQQAHAHTEAWYGEASQNASTPSVSVADCYWWPRPVVEDFGKSDFIADILRPLREAILGDQLRLERGPPQFTPILRCFSDSENKLQELRSCAERVKTGMNTDAVIDIAQLCLRMSSIEPFDDAEIARIKTVWSKSKESHNASAMVPATQKIPTPRLASTASLLQGVLHTVFSLSGSSDTNKTIPLSYFFDASHLIP